MPEDQNTAGDTGERRIVNLLDGLGWSLQGDLNTDVESSLPNVDDHGIDAYMTYPDPFRSKTRGVIIESKNWSWNSLSRGQVEGFFTDTMEKLEGAPGTDDFEEKLNFGRANIVHTAILSVWVQDWEENYDAERFQQWIDSISIPRKRKQAYQILILDHMELMRLACLHQTIEQIQRENSSAEFKFFYPAQVTNDSKRRSNINLEYLLSRYVFAKLEGIEAGYGTKDVSIVFYFDDIKEAPLRFMYQACREYQMTDADEIWVYPYGYSTEDRNVRSQFMRDLQESDPEGPDVSFENFQTIGDFREYEGEVQ